MTPRPSYLKKRASTDFKASILKEGLIPSLIINANLISKTIIRRFQTNRDYAGAEGHGRN